MERPLKKGHSKGAIGGYLEDKMNLIKSDSELQQLHFIGKGLIYNDFSRRAPSGKKYNILHAAWCPWLEKANVNVPGKYFSENADEAIAWLRKNRGKEGLNWKRCGKCRAKICTA